MEWTIERLESCDSTQEEAAKLARAGAPAGTVVIAEQMADGHGQHGRSWHAPRGGLYLSMVLRDVQNPRRLTLALGNAVADVLEVAGVEPRLKWVNDVLVGGKKIAGILVEAESTGSEIDFMIAGIGINLNGDARTWPGALAQNATTLESELAADNCIEDVETFLLESVATWVERLGRGELEQVMAAWRNRDALLGARIGFDPDGDFCTKVIGKAAGITDDGALIIDTDDGQKRFDSGSAFILD